MCAVCVAAITTGVAGSSAVITQTKVNATLIKLFQPKNVYLIILTFFGLFAFLPVAAPILRQLGIHFLADIIYNIYFVFCHQRASHSFHIFDYQMAYCARDTFIWSTVFFIIFIRYKYFFKPLNWKWFILLSIPMALDGGTQFISLFLNTIGKSEIFYESTNLSRAITGTLFGIAVGGSLVSYLITIAVPDWKVEKTIPAKKAVYTTMIASLLFFAAIYSLELSTSPKYPPTGILESKPRYYGYDFIKEQRLIHQR